MAYAKDLVGVRGSAVGLLGSNNLIGLNALEFHASALGGFVISTTTNCQASSFQRQKQHKDPIIRLEVRSY